MLPLYSAVNDKTPHARVHLMFFEEMFVTVRVIITVVLAITSLYRSLALS